MSQNKTRQLSDWVGPEFKSQPGGRLSWRILLWIPSVRPWK